MRSRNFSYLFFRPCAHVCGWSRAYLRQNSERSPPHLFLYLTLYSKTKMVETKGLCGFENQGALFYSNSISFFGFLFYFILVTFTIRLTQTRLLFMLHGMNMMPWLTFPFEFSSMTHPFGFEGFPVGVSLHIQPRSTQALILRLINQTWHHALFDQRRHFNLSTMLKLKSLWM